MTNPDERHITEAEYAAWAEWRAQSFAGELNERFAAILPPGVRFEWQETPVPDTSPAPSPLSLLQGRREVTHQCPADGQYVMPCCGVTPFERRQDRITLDPALVTCHGTEGQP